jgi:hypothetical protein
MIAYTVTVTFDDPRVAAEWVSWLRDVHLADVCAAGALDAEVVRFDGSPARCEVRYHFGSREQFAAYERDHAPRLRAEGLRRFHPDRGVRYERSLGDVLVEMPPRRRDPSRA